MNSHQKPQKPRVRAARFSMAAAFALMMLWTSPLAAAPSAPQLAMFREAISDIAERYIGMPYLFGADPDVDGAADNSHLMCAIYREAARAAGLSFPGYMPMRTLLSHTRQIRASDAAPGDLMVLEDGHAAMIYRFGSPIDFDVIYVSFKRGKVISFNSRNLVYEVYWRRYLDGFYRLDPGLLTPP